MKRMPREKDRPARQLRLMRDAFPGFCPTITRGGGVTWRGTLQPTTDSPTYNVVIVHAFNSTPVVRVASPSLHPKAPHRYQDGRLCLFWPTEWRWTPRASLADTIVPWTAFWLYYYEIWLVTEQWLGPSSPHGRDPMKEAA